MIAAVVIPIYKEHLSKHEISSLRQCTEVLHRYDIYLVCPEGLSLDEYISCTNKPLNAIRFNRTFFEGISGYNHLMKEYNFYKSFENYNYILIYQLDAWIFRDELEYWCGKNYDYIGAPWFYNFNGHEQGGLWDVGNGGLSLRKVKKFMYITQNRNVRLKTIREIFQSEYNGIRDIFHCIIRSLGPYIGNNSLRHFMKSTHESLWEDAFFCIGLSNTRFRLSRPTPEEAAFFSFDKSPKYLYQNITKAKLPFGCHAWNKYQYEEFWKDFLFPMS